MAVSWQSYLQGSSLTSERGLRVSVTDDSIQSEDFKKTLPATVRRQVEAEREATSVSEYISPEVKSQWSLCIMEEGAFPRVLIFPSVVRLAEAIKELDGKEVAIWPVFGAPLLLTTRVLSGKKPVRYLLLPDNLAVPIGAGFNPAEMIRHEDLPEQAEVQDEGWLGEPIGLTGDFYYRESNEKEATADSLQSADTSSDFQDLGNDEDPDEDYEVS